MLLRRRFQSSRTLIGHSGRKEASSSNVGESSSRWTGVGVNRAPSAPGSCSTAAFLAFLFPTELESVFYRQPERRIRDARRGRLLTRLYAIGPRRPMGVGCALTRTRAFVAEQLASVKNLYLGTWKRHRPSSCSNLFLSRITVSQNTR